MGVNGAWSSQLIIADQVVVFGPDQGVFAYDGEPAGPVPGPANPPVASLTGPLTTEDPYGNPVIPGVASYNNTVGTAAALFNGAVGWFYQPVSAWVQIATASPTANPPDEILTLFLNNGIGLAIANSGLSIAQPDQPFVQESWHYVGTAPAPLFAADWANRGSGRAPLAFRVQSDTGMCEMTGGIVSSAGAGSTVFTLPAAYCPQANKTQTVSVYDESTNTAAVAFIESTGAVVISPFTAGHAYDINDGRWSTTL